MLFRIVILAFSGEVSETWGEEGGLKMVRDSELVSVEEG